MARNASYNDVLNYYKFNQEFEQVSNLQNTTNEQIEHMLLFCYDENQLVLGTVMRLSIEITPEQHQLLKVAATMSGESIKDYVLKRTLPNVNDQAAIARLEAFLKPRIKNAAQGNFASESVDEIFDQVLTQAK